MKKLMILTALLAMTACTSHKDGSIANSEGLKPITKPCLEGCSKK